MPRVKPLLLPPPRPLAQLFPLSRPSKRSSKQPLGVKIPPPPPLTVHIVVIDPSGCTLSTQSSKPRINEIERIVEDVGVAVPGLGEGGVDGGEARGGGGSPAGEGRGGLTELGVVAAGFGGALVAGEFLGGCARG